MDKALFRAYVKELVKETVEDEVKKILPNILGEAIAEIKNLQENTQPSTQPTGKAKLSRAQLAEMMGLERIGDTLVASTKNMGAVMPTPPNGIPSDNPAYQAINKDYSAMMKKLGMSK
jgi:hypothetical protein